MSRFRVGLAVFLCLISIFRDESVKAEHEGKLQILLLGDSTCIGSVCRETNPEGPHLEQVIQDLLKWDNELPATRVINQGSNGEYLQRLLTSGRYDRDIKSLPGIDYVLIRYGVNDIRKREDYATNFLPDYRELLARLRSDHPHAQLILMTTIPYLGEEQDGQINALVHKLAEEEDLPLLDMYTRYAEELKHGVNMLNYRRVAMSKIPQKYHLLVRKARYGDRLVVMDNRFDAHLRDVPGWFGDRHPNLAGYHVIGDETARFLAPMIRERIQSARKPEPPGPTVRVAGIVLKWIRTEKEINYQRAEKMIREAAAGGAKIVMTTESFLDGYAIADKSIPLKKYRALGEPIPGGAYFEKLSSLADELDIHLVAGIMEADGEQRRNTAVLINPDGKLIGKYRKQKLGHELVRNTPGDKSLVFDSPFGRAGLMICADRTEQSIVGRFLVNGADFLLCPSGGMFGPRNNDPIVQSRSRQNGRYIVFVHPAEFLVTRPDGTIASRTILGDRLFIPREAIGGELDQNAVFYFDLPVGAE